MTTSPCTVGLTGGLASGKSTVATILERLGAEVFEYCADADPDRERRVEVGRQNTPHHLRPSFNTLDEALRRCGASWDAAQAHGLLTGRLAVGGYTDTHPAGQRYPKGFAQFLDVGR